MKTPRNEMMELGESKQNKSSRKINSELDSRSFEIIKTGNRNSNNK
jgi:hypothetical protein